VCGDPLLEILELRGRGQLAVEQQVADLEEVRLLGQLVDRDSRDAAGSPFVAVDEGDRESSQERSR
jgi:hypothetical protein